MEGSFSEEEEEEEESYCYYLFVWLRWDIRISVELHDQSAKCYTPKYVGSTEEFDYSSILTSANVIKME
jgi:hypothetical protein